MNCLAIAVLSIFMVFVVQGRNFMDKRSSKIKTDTSPDLKFSLEDQTNTQIGDKYVEMLVVVDPTVQKMHKNDAEAERYVKILVNLASKIYTDTNLTAQHGFKIHLIPSKIILLQEDVIFNHSSATENNLYKACNHMNRIGNMGPKKFDHKLFLTRREFGAGGFTRSYGNMCHQNSSCSIVYDKGFSSALIIAHEVAHSFGATHDGFSQYSRYIMSDVILADFSNYKWSLRSQHEFLANIRKYKCLDNKPSHQDVYENPGQYYTMEKQCHLENNENFRLFKPLNKNPCKQLRCQLPNWPAFWKASGQLLEGTECGPNKICMDGECQYKEGFEGSGSPKQY